MTNMTYLALTIGPIYKTFLNVRKTRELWAASFMFSFLMKNIIKCLYEKEKISLDRFIVPTVTTKALDYKGAGLFPDRLIFESQDAKDYNSLETAVTDAIKKFAEYFPEGQDLIVPYLEQYLRIIQVEKDIPAGNNFLEDLYLHMDSLELQNIPLDIEYANKNYLFNFFRNVNKPYSKDFFRENSYDKNADVTKELKLLDATGNIRFESLVEISTREFREESSIIDQETKEAIKYKDLVNKFLWNDKSGDTDNDQRFIEALKAGLPKKFKNYHKYIAIIKADGDKIGSTIKNLKGNVARIKEFSADLLNWAIDTDKNIRKYGAIPIYIGGDDLLLFAPVAYKSKSIIDLVDEIDKIFTGYFEKYLNANNEHPTLSYGIAVHYYKYPLYEAVNQVETLLKEAKNYSENRNAICIRLLKHSGSELKAVYTKSGINTKKYFQGIVEHLDENKLEKSFLSSVAYKLRDNEEVIDIIQRKSEDFQHFFKNNYDDYQYEKEKRNIKGKYLFAVKELLDAFLKDSEKFMNEYLANHPDDEEMKQTSVSHLALEKVYSSIKISRFIKGLDDEK